MMGKITEGGWRKIKKDKKKEREREHANGSALCKSYRRHPHALNNLALDGTKSTSGRINTS